MDVTPRVWAFWRRAGRDGALLRAVAETAERAALLAPAAVDRTYAAGVADALGYAAGQPASARLCTVICSDIPT